MNNSNCCPDTVDPSSTQPVPMSTSAHVERALVDRAIRQSG